MNLNRLTKSYIKDLAHLMKKWHMNTISVDLESRYEVVFIKNKECVHIHVYHEEDEDFIQVYNQDNLKDLLEEFEKSPFYMAKIKV